MSLVIVGLKPEKTFSAEFGSGLAAMEDGDDRPRPSALVHFANSTGFIARFYVYGRNYGPVEERNYLLSMGKQFDLSGKVLQGVVSAAILSDTTSIRYDDHPEENTTFTTTNFGMGFGVHWTFFQTKKFLTKATWDAHVFPAGSGFIYLANARRSGISLTGVFSL